MIQGVNDVENKAEAERSNRPNSRGNLSAYFPQIRQSGEVVTIYTAKHTICTPVDLLADLGKRGEEAVVAHKVGNQKVH